MCWLSACEASRQQHLADFKKEEKFMKKLRKGFTLVELLIVVAILGSLSAAMSLSSGRATASAKASTIRPAKQQQRYT